MGLKDKLLQEKIKSMNQGDRIEMNQYNNGLNIKTSSFLIIHFMCCLFFTISLVGLQNAIDYSLRQSYINHFDGNILVCLIMFINCVLFLSQQGKHKEQIEQFIEEKTK